MARSVAGLICVFLSASAVGAHEGPEHSRIQIINSVVKGAVLDLIGRARRQLEDPECQKVLTDFRDPSGHTLLENLQAMRVSPPEFLDRLWFVDSRKERQCAQANGAFTTPRSLVVFICGAEFMRMIAALGRVGAERVIIHEMLHSLGLGEGGRHPTSEAISRQVTRRCSR